MEVHPLKSNLTEISPYFVHYLLSFKLGQLLTSANDHLDVIGDLLTHLRQPQSLDDTVQEPFGLEIGQSRSGEVKWEEV